MKSFIKKYIWGVDYERIHTRFIEWRKQYIPNSVDRLCIGSKGYEKGINLDIVATPSSLNKKLIKKGDTRHNKTDVVGSITTAPIRSKSFDDVLIFEVFEHVGKPINALLELKRITRREIYLSIPAMRKTRVNNLDKADADQYHKYELNPNDFRLIAKVCGLKVVWRKRFHSFWFSKIFPFDLVGGMFRAFDLYKLQEDV